MAMDLKTLEAMAMMGLAKGWLVVSIGFIWAALAANSVQNFPPTDFLGVPPPFRARECRTGTLGKFDNFL